MKKHILTLFMGAVLFLQSPVLVSAAVLNFENSVDIVQAGDVISMVLVLNTEGKPVNAIAADVLYSKDTLELSKIIDGDSFVNFWVQPPVELEKGKISFSGITPGGITGRDIVVLELEFKAKKEGVGSLMCAQVQVLLHDGLGTPLETSLVPLSLNILGQSSIALVKTEYVDTEAPEPFTPHIMTDTDVFDGQKFLVFATEDKGSGIDYYEVKEGEFGSYERSESPYKIKNQALHKVFFIRAVDKEGNEYVASIYPQNQIPWQQTPLGKAAVVLVCLIILLFLSRRYFKK